MTLGSLCDGLGGWQLAAVRAGIKPLWSSEIDKFCCAVTRRHFPDTVQLGDLTKIYDAPKVDIITAGTPCQSLSIAGRREGLKGESGLFLAAIKLVRRINPEFFIWENVPGAFSSNGGNDFRTVLEEICQEPIPLPKHGWSNAGMVDGRHCQICWRTLDAQHFGLAQRRKRIFLVADFTGRRAAKILFERKSLSRDIAAGEGSQRQTPDRIGECVNPAIGFKWNITCDAAVEKVPSVTCKHPVCTILDMTHADEVLRPVKGDKTNCLNARMGTGGNQVPVVAYGLKLNASCDHIRELQPTLRTAPFACVATKAVRRLTPLECERLMGYPDYWSAGGSDTQRYKAIGNGMAQTIADWILKRVKEVASCTAL